jgi:hypothetical protein
MSELSDFIQSHHHTHGQILSRLDALAVDQSNHASAILSALANQQSELNMLKEMIMALPTQADLDAALNTVGTAVNQLGTDLTAALAALEAKIAAAGTPIDLTAEIAKANSIATQLTNLDASAVAANPPAA